MRKRKGRRRKVGKSQKRKMMSVASAYDMRHDVDEKRVRMENDLRDESACV